jgi:HPr kinase/phosphorylase
VTPSSSYLTVRELIANPALALELFAGSRGLERPVRSPRVQRIDGSVESIARSPREALVALGPAAVDRLAALAPPERRRLVAALAARALPALVLPPGRPVPEALLEASRRQDQPVLVARAPLARSLQRLAFFLGNRLGAEITLHGVLVEVFGVGLLILGPSGIGKSESALELATRGHRLIADDMVIVHRAGNRSLMGSGSGLARYHMEIRGIGIIDVKELFGVAAVLATKEIELVVELEAWTPGESYDRLGLDQLYRPILDIPVPHLRVPVSPGRNISVILEVAARNHLLRKQGHHTARELNRRLLERMREGRG